MNPFTERQKFTQVWLWLILVGSLLVPMAITAYQVMAKGEHFDAATYITAIALPVSILFLMWSFRLDTKIDSEGVHYKFFPFHIKYKTIAWAEISKAYIRQYKPIVEYGGWGIKYGLGDKGKAINVKGNIGFQIELSTKKKVLIGTQEGEAIKAYLIELVKNKIIAKDIINP